MGRIGWRIAWMLVLLVAVGVASAAGPRAVKKQVEASMLVTGTIDIATDGRVSGHTIDQVDEVPPAVIGMLERAVADWRFEPIVIDGGARTARTRMSVRIGAKRHGDDAYIVDVRSARFGEPSPADLPVASHMSPPNYPMDAVRAGITGTVYLVLRVGRDGQVEEVVTEQVNLRAVASERMMEVWRHRLSAASVRAAQGWTFELAPGQQQAGGPQLSFRVPVDFTINDQRPARYGEWEVYVPGPRQPIPWKERDDAGFSPDVLAAGGIYPLRHQGPRLVTGLNGA